MAVKFEKWVLNFRRRECQCLQKSPLLAKYTMPKKINREAIINYLDDMGVDPDFYECQSDEDFVIVRTSAFKRLEV